MHWNYAELYIPASSWIRCSSIELNIQKGPISKLVPHYFSILEIHKAESKRKRK